MGIALPEDYVALVSAMNGGAIQIAGGQWVEFLKIEEVESAHHARHGSDSWPRGLVQIGGDGGGLGYFYATRLKGCPLVVSEVSDLTVVQLAGARVVDLLRNAPALNGPDVDL
jgi:hypothetical protein